MISRTGSFYAVLRQHQPWLAHGDLALQEDQHYYRLGRRTLAEERHSSLFTSLICASQHMANRLKCALPACLRVRTAGGRRMLSRRTASPLRACVWALPACTQFVRSRSQPSRVPTIFEWSPCSPRVDSLRPWSSPCAPGLVDTHPLTHPGSYGQCIATNAPAKGIVASPFHRFPRLAERPPGGAKEGLLALHRTDGGVWAAEVVGRCLRARPAARVKCASVRARRAVPRRLESRPSLSLFLLPIASRCRQSLLLDVVILHCYRYSIFAFARRSPPCHLNQR